MADLVNSERWAPLIGRLFLAFGYIEKTAHDGIREWGGDLIHSHVHTMRLSQRLDLVADLANATDGSAETKRAFCEAVRQAKGLAKWRNHVAHNPLLLVILQEGDEPPLYEAIAHPVRKDEISFEKLQNIVEQAESCSESISHWFIGFRVEKMKLARLDENAARLRAAGGLSGLTA